VSVLLRVLIALSCAMLPLAVQAQQKVERGAVLLVAAPELSDPNFFQTVVLVMFPATSGPTGVILNRPTRYTLKEAFPDEPQLKAKPDPLYFGGPVRPAGLMFLFRHRDGSGGARSGSAVPAEALPVLDDLYLGSDGDLLDGLLRQPNGGVQRYFVGYSGWAPMQLQAEIAQGAWHVLPADLDTILRMDVKTMWRDLLVRATAVET
jgi:putative transcriptional regulator